MEFPSTLVPTIPEYVRTGHCMMRLVKILLFCGQDGLLAYTEVIIRLLITGHARKSIESEYSLHAICLRPYNTAEKRSMYVSSRKNIPFFPHVLNFGSMK